MKAESMFGVLRSNPINAGKLTARIRKNPVGGKASAPAKPKAKAWRGVHRELYVIPAKAGIQRER